MSAHHRIIYLRHVPFLPFSRNCYFFVPKAILGTNTQFPVSIEWLMLDFIMMPQTECPWSHIHSGGTLVPQSIFWDHVFGWGEAYYLLILGLHNDVPKQRKLLRRQKRFLLIWRNKWEEQFMAHHVTLKMTTGPGSRKPPLMWVGHLLGTTRWDGASLRKRQLLFCP